MKILKKILKIIVPIVIIITLMGNIEKVTNASSEVTEGKPVKVGVLLNRLDIDYIPSVIQSLKDIQKENEGKVEFEFVDAKRNQNTQNDQIDKMLREGVDLLLLNIVDIENAQPVINKIKEANVPVILFNREPTKIDPIKSYKKAYYVGTDASQVGFLQGKILVNMWNNKKAIDINKDNVMQYIMLTGEHDNLEAIARTKYSISTINDSGIKTQQLALRDCEWNDKLAQNAIEGFILKYGNEIEAIIANNNAMAVGAIKALQEYGYNNDDETPTIPVVGVDATTAA